jgi:hypothetical protein
MFNKGDLLIFEGKPSIFNKNIIVLLGAAGVVKNTYKLKIGDTFNVVESLKTKLVLKPVNLKIEDDYWFCDVKLTNTFKLKK